MLLQRDDVGGSINHPGAKNQREIVAPEGIITGQGVKHASKPYSGV